MNQESGDEGGWRRLTQEGSPPVSTRLTASYAVTHSKYSWEGLVAFVTLPLLSNSVMQASVFQLLLHLIHGTSDVKEAMR